MRAFPWSAALRVAVALCLSSLAPAHGAPSTRADRAFHFAGPSPARVTQILAQTSDIIWKFSDHYFHGGDYPQAIRLHHLLERMDPHSEEPYALAAWLEWSSGDTPAAMADLRRGIQQNPERYYLYSEMGNCYGSWLKQPANAMPYYIRATSFYGETPVVVFHSLAHTAEQVGDYSRAAITWRMSLIKSQGEPVESSVEQRNLRRVLSKIKERLNRQP